MKKLFLCLFPLLVLGCKSSGLSSQNVSLDYDSFLDHHIEWSEIFNFPMDSYYIYIYHPSCGHCKDIKDAVLAFAYWHADDFYFVIYSSVINVITNTETIIGKSNYQEVGIIGTPTLFLIKNHAIYSVFTGSKEIIATLYNSIY